MRMGFLRALEHTPGPDAHAVHQRLCECLPFIRAASEAADGPVGECLAQLEQFLRGI